METSSRSGSTSDTPGWLVKDGVVLASVEVADGRAARIRGLLGRDGIDGVLVLDGVRSVHTFGMRFDIDVVFCDRDGVVLRALSVPRWRVTRPVRRAARALESEAGTIREWGLEPGDRLELR